MDNIATVNESLKSSDVVVNKEKEKDGQNNDEDGADENTIKKRVNKKKPKNKPKQNRKQMIHNESLYADLFEDDVLKDPQSFANSNENMNIVIIKKPSESTDVKINVVTNNVSEGDDNVQKRDEGNEKDASAVQISEVQHMNATKTEINICQSEHENGNVDGVNGFENSNQSSNTEDMGTISGPPEFDDIVFDINIDDEITDVTKNNFLKRPKIKVRNIEDIIETKSEPPRPEDFEIELQCGIETSIRVNYDESKLYDKSTTCYNCLGNHIYNDCTEKLDVKKMAINKRNIESKQLQRIHELNNFKPGVLSKETIKALELRKNQYPPWIYKMRKAGAARGYPPGYLKQLIENETLQFYTGNDSANDNDDNKGIRINKDRIIYYDGFNNINKNSPAEKAIHKNHFPIYTKEEYGKKLSKYAIKFYKKEQRKNNQETDDDFDERENQEKQKKRRGDIMFHQFNECFLDGELILEKHKDGLIMLTDEMVEKISEKINQTKKKRRMIDPERYTFTQGMYLSFLDGSTDSNTILDLEATGLISLTNDQRNFILAAKLEEEEIGDRLNEIEDVRNYYGVYDADYNERRKSKNAKKRTIGTQTEDSLVIGGDLMRHFTNFLSTLKIKESEESDKLYVETKLKETLNIKSNESTVPENSNENSDHITGWDQPDIKVWDDFPQLSRNKKRNLKKQERASVLHALNEKKQKERQKFQKTNQIISGKDSAADILDEAALESLQTPMERLISESLSNSKNKEMPSSSTMKNNRKKFFENATDDEKLEDFITGVDKNKIKKRFNKQKPRYTPKQNNKNKNEGKKTYADMFEQASSNEPERLGNRNNARNGSNEASDNDARNGANEASDNNARNGSNEASDNNARNGANEASGNNARNGANEASDNNARNGANETSDNDARNGANEVSDNDARNGANETSDNDARNGANEASDNNETKEKKTGRKMKFVQQGNKIKYIKTEGSPKNKKRIFVVNNKKDKKNGNK